MPIFKNEDFTTFLPFNFDQLYLYFYIIKVGKITSNL